MFKNCVASNKWTMIFFVAGKNMRNVARWNWSAKSSASGYYSYWWEGKSVWRGKVIILCGMQAHHTCASGQLQKQKRESSKSCLCDFHSSAPSCLANRGALVLLAECFGCDQVGCCGLHSLAWISSSSFSVLCLEFSLSLSFFSFFFFLLCLCAVQLFYLQKHSIHLLFGWFLLLLMFPSTLLSQDLLALLEAMLWEHQPFSSWVRGFECPESSVLLFSSLFYHLTYSERIHDFHVLLLPFSMV